MPQQTLRTYLNSVSSSLSELKAERQDIFD